MFFKELSFFYHPSFASAGPFTCNSLERRASSTPVGCCFLGASRSYEKGGTNWTVSDMCSIQSLKKLPATTFTLFFLSLLSKLWIFSILRNGCLFRETLFVYIGSGWVAVDWKKHNFMEHCTFWLWFKKIIQQDLSWGGIRREVRGKGVRGLKGRQSYNVRSKRLVS